MPSALGDSSRARDAHKRMRRLSNGHASPLSAPLLVLTVMAAYCCVCAIMSSVAASPAQIRPPPELEAAAHEAVLLYRAAIAAHSIQEEARAMQLFRASIDKYPLAHAYNNLGLLLIDSGGGDKDANAATRELALATLSQGAAVAREANETDTLAAIESNIGHIIRSQNVKSVVLCLEAIAHFDLALQADPLHVNTLYHKASALYELREFHAAERVYRQILALEPKHVSANMDLGGIFFSRRDVAQAVHHQDIAIAQAQSISIKHGAIANKGNFLRSAGLLVQALEAFEQAYALVPDEPMAIFNLAVARRPLCLWDRIQDLHDELLDIAERKLSSSGGRIASLSPFESTLMKVSDQIRKRLAIADSQQTHQAITLELLPSRLLSSNFTLAARPVLPLRVGYLSYDFRDHAMGQLVLGFLDNHDNRFVESYCYSYGPNDGSEWRRRAETSCTVFKDIALLSDLEASKQVALDQVDVVVDLMGHTTGARIGIPVLKPSRIVVNYLGYPGTAGSTATDFAVVDRLVVPPERAQASMSEQVVYLPSTYQSNLHEREPQSCRLEENDFDLLGDFEDPMLISIKRCPLATRSDHNLPPRAIVFCNFNTINKMEPVSFSLWLQVLHQAPESVLWLLEPNSEDAATIMTTLHSEAQAHGVHPSRVIFAKWAEKRAHMARLTLADIFLDSLVYNAHSTASDALWANVPLVTLWGDSFPSRVAASLIQNALPEFPEIVPHSVKEYEQLAVELAHSPVLLKRYRRELAAQAIASPLFDSKQTTVSLEASYEAMHDLTHRAMASPHQSQDSYQPQKKRFHVIVSPEAAMWTLDPASRAANTKSRVQKAVDDGLRHQQAGNPQIAQYFYQLALQTDQNHGDALHLLATLYFKRGDARQARLLLQKVVESHPDVVLYRMNAALVSASLGDAENAAEQVLRLEPLNTVAFTKLVEICFDAEDFESAVRTFKAFGGLIFSFSSSSSLSDGDEVLSDQERESMFLRYSYALAMTGGEVEAIDLLEDVIVQHPTYYKAGYNLVVLYNRQGLYRSGEQWLVKVVLAESHFNYETRGKSFRKLPRPVGNTNKKQKVVAIYCYEYGQAWWGQWGPSSLETGLGGSEGAVVFLSAELQRLGYWVEVYGDPPEQDTTTIATDSQGVAWYPHYAYDPEDSDVDIFIAWRYHASLVVGQRAKSTFLWMHDIPNQEIRNSAMLRKAQQRGRDSNFIGLDGIFCVSAFQASFFPPQVHQQNLIILTTNGLDPQQFLAADEDDDGSVEANRATNFVYGSAPNRGLERVLRAWPQIRKAIPEATLTVYYGFTSAFDQWGNTAIPDFAAWKHEIETLLHTLPGVHYAGLVGHKELARGYAQAGFYLYPTMFGETSSVTLMKAMASGAIPITSRYNNSALKETCGGFDLGPQQALENDSGPEWIDLWVESVVNAVYDEGNQIQAFRDRMKAFARTKYRWASVAEQWHQVFASDTAGSIAS